MTAISLTGFKELEAELKRIDKKASTSLGRKVIRKAANIVKDEIKQRVPVGETGNLKRGLKVSVKKRRFGFIAKIGFDTSIAHHAYLVEFGHKIIFKNKKTGKKFYIGKDVPEHPFFTPAWDSKVDDAYKSIENSLREVLQV